jgi:hypothetical protein
MQLPSPIESDLHGDDAGESKDALRVLRQFARPRLLGERCELCGAELKADHKHLLDRRSAQIVCSCDACATLLCAQEGAKFLHIPDRILKLDNFAFDDRTWTAMMLPINLAFFVRQPNGKTQAMYPSPAGAIQSLIGIPSWKDLASGGPALSGVEPEVEALIVNRIGDAASYFIAPLDACYRLTGLIRTKWRGLSGGREVWHAVADFFADLERRATLIVEVRHA